MRYIGNKTRLLGFIRRVVRTIGVRPGVAVDPFTGTASVARALKRWGFGVVASDVMEYAFVFGRAYVQAPAIPTFPALGPELDGAPPTLAAVLAHLNALPPEPGLIHDSYSPEGREGSRHGRMYFTPANAARIDGIRGALERWRSEGRIGEDGFYVLLAALLEAADRVANTAGVYASFIKTWQPNARNPLRLRMPRLIEGNGCRAEREDALRLVSGMEPFELLYLDPPYNGRQYPGYYHVPEAIAASFAEPPELRGKTGLLPDADKRSDWAKRRHCEDALEALVAEAPCRHILMSYNTEGIIPETTIARVMRRHGRPSTYRVHTRGYRRYRSDADGANRRYSGDAVEERLYYVRKL